MTEIGTTKVAELAEILINSYKGGRLHTNITLINLNPLKGQEKTSVTFSNRAELKGAVKLFILLSRNKDFHDTYLNNHIVKLISNVERNIIRPANWRNTESRRTILKRAKEERKTEGTQRIPPEPKSEDEARGEVDADKERPKHESLETPTGDTPPSSQNDE